MRRRFWLAVASLVAGSTAQAAQQGPIILTPASPWNMDYAQDSCRLARMFKLGDERVFFYMERFAPSSSQFVVIAGKALSRLDGREVTLRFAPVGPQSDTLVYWGKHGEFAPALIAPWVRLFEKQSDEEAGRTGQAAPSAGVRPEIEKAVDALEVLAGKRPLLRLELGSMGGAFEAMRKCTDELVTHWGLDAEAQRNLSRPPVPKGNPGHWVSHADYPSEALRKGVQGVVPFRLIVGPDGVPSDCHLQRPTEPAEFNATVCRILLKRARFEPALDAAGKPIKSCWSSTFNFMIP